MKLNNSSACWRPDPTRGPSSGSSSWPCAGQSGTYSACIMNPFSFITDVWQQEFQDAKQEVSQLLHTAMIGTVTKQENESKKRIALLTLTTEDPSHCYVPMARSSSSMCPVAN
ncbi:hypothetical protein CHARACLAT_028943 [Characodon lateralis]|uniref:Uncharacterized protein n=1 Tax=Characodon lateralis TaxID=208331 RepID=A0ABU7CV70_9TELE|nr:hypothetical protein [Characodon lateralis]